MAQLQLNMPLCKNYMKGGHLRQFGLTRGELIVHVPLYIHVVVLALLDHFFCSHEVASFSLIYIRMNFLLRVLLSVERRAQSANQSYN